jgi:hypothetical protein
MKDAINARRLGGRLYASGGRMTLEEKKELEQLKAENKARLNYTKEFNK